MLSGCSQLIWAHSHLMWARVLRYSQLMWSRKADVINSCDLCYRAATLNRNFDVVAPNLVWTTDITYVWTLEGWLYVAVVIDLFSRQVVGWAIDDHMRTSLCVSALQMAFWRRKPKPGLLIIQIGGVNMPAKNTAYT